MYTMMFVLCWNIYDKALASINLHACSHLLHEFEAHMNIFSNIKPKILVPIRWSNRFLLIMLTTGPIMVSMF